MEQEPTGTEPTEQIEAPVEVVDPMAEYIARRKEELGLTDAEAEPGEGEEAPTEAGGEAVADPAAEGEPSPAEAEPKPEDEPASRVAQRLLKKEAKLRAEREAFDKERQQYQEKLAAYEKEKRLASSDLYGFLQTLELPPKALVDLASEVLARDLGDNATPEVKAKLAQIEKDRQYQKKLAELEQQQEEKLKQFTEQQRQQQEQAYLNSLQSAVSAPDVSRYEHVGKFLSGKYGAASAEDLYQAAYQIANNHYIESQGAFMPIEQVFATIERNLADYESKLTPQTAQTPATPPAKPAKTKPTTLTNKSVAQPASDKDLEGLSYEELKQRLRDRAEAKLREGVWSRS